MCGGDPYAASPSESMAEVLKAYNQYLPQIMQTTGQNIGPLEQNLFNAQQQIAPQQQDLNANLYEQYAPRYAQANSNSELANINGAGGQEVLAADQLNRQVDPEFYSGRAAVGKSITDLLGGMDPNKLTDSELANQERSNNRLNANTGNLTNTNQLNSIKNALTFGDRLNQKKSLVGQAIANTGAALPNLRSGSDAFAQATGRTGTQAFSSGQGFNTSGNTGQSALGVGANALNMTGGLQSQANEINSQRRDSLDRVTGVLGSMPSD